MRKMGIILEKRFCTLSLIMGIVTAIALFQQPAMSQDIDECLECHSDRYLTKTDASGKVHSLYVDKQMFLNSVHGELNYTCIECHEEATLEHPAEGVPDVKCGGCHEEELASYEMSRHQQVAIESDRQRPECYDCHTMHYEFYRDDPRSSINIKNIPETCGACHEGIVNGPGTFASFIVARLKGHGKVNLAGDFRIDRCLTCHFEVGNHGKKEKEAPDCVKCHDPVKQRLNLGPIHKEDVFTNPPLRVAVKLFYGFGLAMIAFAFMSMAGKKYLKPKAEEEKENRH